MRRVHFLIVGSHPGLDSEQEDLQISLLLKPVGNRSRGAGIEVPTVVSCCRYGNPDRLDLGRQSLFALATKEERHKIGLLTCQDLRHPHWQRSDKNVRLYSSIQRKCSGYQSIHLPP